MFCLPEATQAFQQRALHCHPSERSFDLDSNPDTKRRGPWKGCQITCPTSQSRWPIKSHKKRDAQIFDSRKLIHGDNYPFVTYYQPEMVANQLFCAVACRV
ncbi:hypothetical protein CDAR_434401 [Caerostris darwini]|uniref:Uncharacterized protein n=1 Tax=Caerostris darwini TaxID=1538125 RepID=A0AAV4PNI1_9ARAC|nr:hypothetical protein CDAR_434401 [Caerostris darwini]